MNILIVSYVYGITESIKKVIKKKYQNANIDVVNDTFKATRIIQLNNYDIVVIDMMVQETINVLSKPILVPALEFLKELNEKSNNTKAFALFDEDETNKKGQDEVLALGYSITNFEFSSNEWEKKLLDYI